MLFFILGLLLASSHGIQAVERISSFQSEMTVNQDSSISVQETIEVVSEGRSVRHGIVREFPTRYKDPYGHNYEVLFTIKGATIDGKRVPYHVQNVSNGKLIYLGDTDIDLPPGRYSFVIKYETKRQLGFFKEYDELYWNVTGTGWRLPIDRASARVYLPEGVPADQIHVEGYTGYQGSKGQNYTARVNDGVAIFATTEPLAVQQGLTIVVTWPKGFVDQPTQWQEWQWFFKDNKYVAIGLLGLLLLLLFYLLVWIRFSRSQKLGTVIPLFYPPKNMSPGLMHYFVNMGYDAKVLAADLVNMAVRGFITIHYDSGRFFNGSYTLKRKGWPRGEFGGVYRAVFMNIFDDQNDIILNKSNRRPINTTIDMLSKTYGRETEKWFLSGATSCVFWGILLSLIYFLIALVIQSEALLLFLVAYGVVIIFFYWLLRGYTPKGLEIKRQIEGFKLFLKTTEEERLKIIGTPPTKTPELYETYLPYAIALGVEKEWSRQFAPLFEKMKEQGNPYTVMWITGGSFDTFNAGTFASQISSSINSSIASSYSPPGRSSGSGGRGSSGGGGGGGGGGGW